MTAETTNADRKTPTRPIVLVSPFPPGGSVSLVARIVAEKMSETLGQSFIIDNRAGAGGNIGAAAVARAPQDGYTLLFATTGQAATNKLMYENMQYDPEKDFAPVVLAGKSPVLIGFRSVHQHQP